MTRSPHDFMSALCTVLQRRDHTACKDLGFFRDQFHGTTIAEFENFVLEQGLVGKAEILEALQAFYGVPALDVEGDFFEHHLVHMFPRDVMLRHAFIPYRHDGEVLFVVAHNPSDSHLLEVIGQFVSYDIELLVGIESDICNMVKEFDDESLTELQPDLDPQDEALLEHEVRDTVNSVDE